jgi:chromate reductase, NAD(P)H dehydrogenase (quinone)
MQVVGICGSLRAGSSNLALLRAAAANLPPGMSLILYEGLGALPWFNPDLDGEGSAPPPPVAKLRELLAGADAFILCSPEYAHGIPGVVKNGLDWLVSCAELTGKPVAIFNASAAGGEFAQRALLEVLSAMSWPVSQSASLLQPFLRRKLSADGPFDDPQLTGPLKAALIALAGEIAKARTSG